MPLRIDETANRLVGQSVRHILHPLPTFVLDNLSLRVEFVLVQVAREERHPFGLHVKRSLHIFVGISKSGTVLVPRNIMCSKKWAKPVKPGRSFFDPTW